MDSSADAETLAILEAIMHSTSQPFWEHIVMRTDSQEAFRMFLDNTLPRHIHSILPCHLVNHPFLYVTLPLILGHHGSDEHNQAHELTRVATFSRPLCLWLAEYNPVERRKLLHKERTYLLKELLDNAYTFTTPLSTLSREDIVVLRRLYTSSVMIPLFRPYIQGLPGRLICPHYNE